MPAASPPDTRRMDPAFFPTFRDGAGCGSGDTRAHFDLLLEGSMIEAARLEAGASMLVLICQEMPGH